MLEIEREREGERISSSHVKQYQLYIPRSVMSIGIEMREKCFFLIICHLMGAYFLFKSGLYGMQIVRAQLRNHLHLECNGIVIVRR